MTDLRYPIGKFHFDASSTSSEDQKQKLIDDIAQAPANLRAAVKGLSPQQLDTPYRPEGWTVRQVAPRSGQPSQRLRPLQASAHRRRANDQTLRRRPLGAPGRHAGNTRRSFIGVARFLA